MADNQVEMDNWLQEKLKKARGEFYEIDEERNVIIYDPACNNHGKWDGTAHSTTKNMAKIAAQKQLTVEATFNGTLFQVTPGMTAEEAMQAYKIEKKRRESSPEYIAKESAFKAEMEAIRVQRKLQKANDDRLIKDEVLNVDGMTHYFNQTLE